MKDIIEEATSLDALGVKELNIIAQDTSAYGIDLYGKYELPELIRGICDATNIPWIRLLYCYPDKITDELVAEIRDNPRVVKYIDIPIQHISDRVLKAMNRHGDSAMIRDAVKKLREIPGIVLRSTAIVGFPARPKRILKSFASSSRKRSSSVSARLHIQEKKTLPHMTSRIRWTSRLSRTDTTSSCRPSLKSAKSSTKRESARPTR